MIPLFYSIGAGRVAALPLDARQHEEFFLTAAQSLFAVALLLGLQLSLRSGLILLGLFGVQAGLAFISQNNESFTIGVLTALAWVYLVGAVGLFVWQRQQLLEYLKVGLFNRAAPIRIAADHPKVHHDPQIQPADRDSSKLE